MCEVLQRRVPGPDIAGDRLERRDWWSGPRVFVLADDYDMVVSNLSGAFDPLLELLAYGQDIGVHVVAARSSAGAARPDKLLRRLSDLNQPALVLSCPPVEGPVLGVKTRLMTPGRAMLVSRRTAELVQTALVPEPGLTGTSGR
jgi:S-DNA-T family DNA segregation ATPase FtsK/SpoIIIE